MNETNEQKAQDFLAYIAKNENTLKTALAKNVRYDREIFDDAFNDTVIRVYNSIEKNGTNVSDYRNYFFISLKWQYVLLDNRAKKHKATAVRDWFDNNDVCEAEEETDKKEEAFDGVVELLGFIRERITEQYNEQYAAVFFEYYMMKANGGCSYRKVAAKLGLRESQVEEIVKTVRKFVREDDLIARLRFLMTLDDSMN